MKIKGIGMIILLLMLVVGCSEALPSYEGSLELTGLKENVSIAYNDIYAMESVTKEVESVSSTGEEAIDTVKGVLLNTVLQGIGEAKEDYSSIRFIAGDGYAISVPIDIIMNKEIVLAYEFNSELLIDKEMPLRVAIDDVLSMYFISNLVTIEFSNVKIKESTSKDQMIILLETAIADLPSEDYMYYEDNDQAILVSDLFEALSVEEVDEANFIAVDGHEKSESMSVLKEGFIKYTGKDAPLFTGLDLPKGMHIKSIMKMTVGTQEIVSINSSIATLKNITIDNNKGVILSELVEMVGLKAEYYVLKASDDYSMEVADDALKTAVAYISDTGTVTVTFDSSDPKKATVKNLLMITAGDGSNVTTFSNDVSDETGSSDKENSEDSKTDSSEEILWTISFDGLEDGAFDMTSDRAQRKLELISLHTERMKDDITYLEDWEGYKVLDMLDFLHVEEFNSLIIIAGDGYEIELNADQIDDETILAVTKDGEALESDKLVQLVQNTQFATTWLRNVVKIIIK